MEAAGSEVRISSCPSSLAPASESAPLGTANDCLTLDSQVLALVLWQHEEEGGMRGTRLETVGNRGSVDQTAPGKMQPSRCWWFAGIITAAMIIAAMIAVLGRARTFTCLISPPLHKHLQACGDSGEGLSHTFAFHGLCCLGAQVVDCLACRR